MKNTKGGQAARPVVKRIKMSLIDRPEKIVRLEIDDDEVTALAESIRERGLLQPILVHPKGGRYCITAGDRRYLAHEKLGATDILCVVRESSPEDVVWDRVTENIQRVDLTPFEEGVMYAGLHKEKGFSVAVIAQKVGKSAGVVQRRMDILRMPESFQTALHDKRLSIAVAEELWSCPDAARREYFLDLALEHGVTSTVAREWVQDYKKSLRAADSGPEDISSPLAPYENVPIFRACDSCRGPVDLEKVRDLRVCPACFEAIVKALREAG